MTSRDTGQRAEVAAKTYLEMRNYQVVELNWRRPQSEVDIIAHKDGVIHFVEVKYREDDQQGGGLEAITPAKLRRMQRGAELWVAEERYTGEYTLDVIEVAAPDYTVMTFVENVF